MKKTILLLIVTITLIISVACENKPTKSNQVSGYSGLNAEIVEINSELDGFVVKSLDENSVLGEKCYIGLSHDDVYYIYADNETAETIFLIYDDFVVGDVITIDTNSVENNYALASKIQLLTQRK